MAKQEELGTQEEQTDIVVEPEFETLFRNQRIFQESIVGKGNVRDDPQQLGYHSLSAIKEICEVLDADQRWKTHRNTKYDRKEKLAEVADVFIFAINIALYSDYSAKEVLNAIVKKQRINFERLQKSKEKGELK